MKECMEIGDAMETVSIPLVTVIVPTYKNQEWLLATINSVLEQSYPNMQFILSDDGSGVLDIPKMESYIKERLGKNVKKYRIRVNEINMGTVAHMNLTAGLAEGKYIKFLACGDAFYGKDALEHLVCFAQTHETLVVTSKSAVCSPDFSINYYEFPDAGRVTKLNNRIEDSLFELLAESNIISAVGTLFDRRFFTEFGGFDESYHLLEDWPCWLRLTRDGYSIPCLNKIIGYYADGGVSSKDGTAFEAGNLRQDMILCYEKEILPNLSRLSGRTQRYVLYQYERLKVYSERVGPCRVRFVLKYLPFEGRRRAKRLAKKALKVIKRGKRS